MKKLRFLAAGLLAAALIGGCASNVKVKNATGQALSFARVYSPDEMNGGKFVVVEFNRMTKEHSVVSISSERPRSIKPNQEILVFDKALTKYSIALDNFAGLRYYTNSIPDGINYRQQEAYFVCPKPKPSKADGYTACSSDWYGSYFPYELVVAYGKGQMPQSVWDGWKRTTENWVNAYNPVDIINKLNIVNLLEGGSSANVSSRGS